MTDPVHRQEGIEDANVLSKHTTPTWEIELLISGATVFALMQLPALLDRGYAQLLSQTGNGMEQLFFFAFLYLKSAVIVLIATFVLHLGLRAYWIAVVGLYSVYPDGIRFDAMSNWGPIQRALIRQRARSIPDLIERADNRSSLVFGAGIGIALFFLLLLCVMMVAITFATLICGISGRWNWFASITAIFTVVLFVPFVILLRMDRWISPRVPENGRMHRWITKGVRGYQSIGIGTGYNLPLLLFQTHLGRSCAARIPIAFAPVVVLLIAHGEAHLDGINLLPRESAGASGQIINDHYATRRNVDADDAPYIDDLFESGNYLSLFVPYREAQAFGSLRENCPDAIAPAAEGHVDLRGGLLLACYARIHGISIDGVPIRSVAFDFARDPKSGQRGLLAVLPIQQLARGRHEMVIAGAFGENGTQAAPDRIPFWR
jgi:hypothetical protein